MKSLDTETIADLKATLEDALAIHEPTTDDLYELATALGQAVRGVRFGGAAELASLVARARAILAGESPLVILAALNEDAMLGRLESELEDEEVHPVTLFATLIDLDDHAAAAAALGHPEAARALLADAITLLQVHAPTAARTRTWASRHLEARVPPDDVAHAFWAAAAAAQPDEALVAEPVLPAVAAWLAAQAAPAPTGRVLTFPIRHPTAVRADWKMAAADGQPALPETYVLESDPGQRWQLVLERPQAHWELVCYADPGATFAFEARVGDVVLEVKDDGLGRRAVVLVGDDTPVQVAVGEVVVAWRWPEVEA